MPELSREGVDFFVALKRRKVTAGRYRDVSVFELANRVMSDLVVLFAARQMLVGQSPFGDKRLVRVGVMLGTAQGLDLIGTFPDGQRVVGECFNVAQAFFPTKHSKAERELRKAECARRVIAFNHDAVANPSRYAADPEFTYVPIDVAAELKRETSCATS